MPLGFFPQEIVRTIPGGGLVQNSTPGAGMPSTISGFTMSAWSCGDNTISGTDGAVLFGNQIGLGVTSGINGVGGFTVRLSIYTSLYTGSPWQLFDGTLSSAPGSAVSYAVGGNAFGGTNTLISVDPNSQTVQCYVNDEPCTVDPPAFGLPGWAASGDIGNASMLWSVGGGSNPSDNGVADVWISVPPPPGRIWFRKNNGNWNANGSADPSTGIGGIDISSITAPFTPGGWLNTGFFGGQLLQFNFGGSSFGETIPSLASVWGSGTTLNPADKDTAVTLSGGDLEMSIGGSQTGKGARATTSSLTQGGLRYFEAIMLTAAQNWAVGVSEPGATLNKPSGDFTDLAGWAVVADSGDISVNGTTVATLGVIAAGDVIGVALQSGPINLDIVANRRQWINSDLSGVALPSNGLVTLASGDTVTPEVFLHTTPLLTPDDFCINSGTAGGWDAPSPSLVFGGAGWNWPSQPPPSSPVTCYTQVPILGGPMGSIIGRRAAV